MPNFGREFAIFMDNGTDVSTPFHPAGSKKTYHFGLIRAVRRVFGAIGNLKLLPGHLLELFV